MAEPAGPWILPYDPPGEPWPILSTEHEELIPNDSFAVVLMREPLPEPVDGELAPVLDEVMTRADAMFTGFLAELPPERAQTFRAILGNDARQAFDSLGVDTNPRFALYSVTNYSVLRIRLADAEKARVALWKAGLNETQAVFHGQPYWFAPLPDGSLRIWSLVGDDLVTAILPPGEKQREVMPLVLGQRIPEASLSDTGKVGRIQQRYGFTSHFIAWGTPRYLIGVAQGLDGEHDSFEECSPDSARLERVVPLILAGFDELSEQRLSLSVFLQTPPNIAKDLARVSAPIPGLGSEKRLPGLYGGGIGVDPRALGELLSQIGTAIAQHPMRCPYYRWLNGAPPVAKLWQRPDSAVPRMTGTSLLVFETARRDRKLPTPVNFIATLGATDPRGLVEGIYERSGRPAPPKSVSMVPFDDLGSGRKMPGKVFIGDSALVYATDTQRERKLEAIARRSRASEGVLFSFFFDLQWFGADLLSSFDDPELQRVGTAIAETFERIESRILIEDKGVRLRFDLDFTPPQ